MEIKSNSGGGVASVTAVAIANGGDNVAVYVPLFARSSPHDLGLILGVFGSLVAVWCLMAHWLTRHGPLASLVSRWGRRIMPYALIAIGGVILVRAGVIHVD